jgi:phage baseplate assembly protein W
MAFNQQQINPLDLNPNVAVGINLPLSGPAVFVSNYTTYDALKTDLINFFLTNPGERPMNPTFGGGLRDFIFSQIEEENINGLKENIEFKLQKYFPQVGISSLEVLQDADNNTLIVELKYFISNSNIQDTITFEF